MDDSTITEPAPLNAESPPGDDAAPAAHDALIDGAAEPLKHAQEAHADAARSDSTAEVAASELVVATSAAAAAIDSAAELRDPVSNLFEEHNVNDNEGVKLLASSSEPASSAVPETAPTSAVTTLELDTTQSPTPTPAAPHSPQQQQQQLLPQGSEQATLTSTGSQAVTQQAFQAAQAPAAVPAAPSAVGAAAPSPAGTRRRSVDTASGNDAAAAAKPRRPSQIHARPPASVIVIPPPKPWWLCCAAQPPSPRSWMLHLLTPLDRERWAALCARAAIDVNAARDASHASLLRQLWNLSSPTTQLNATDAVTLASSQWAMLGFTGANPAADLNSPLPVGTAPAACGPVCGGLLALHTLVYVGRSSPELLVDIVNNGRTYPWAATLCSVVAHLKVVCGLTPLSARKSERPTKVVRRHFLYLFAAYDSIVERLATLCMRLVDKLWARLLASPVEVLYTRRASGATPHVRGVADQPTTVGATSPRPQGQAGAAAGSSAGVASPGLRQPQEVVQQLLPATPVKPKEDAARAPAATPLVIRDETLADARWGAASGKSPSSAASSVGTVGTESSAEAARDAMQDFPRVMAEVRSRLLATLEQADDAATLREIETRLMRRADRMTFQRTPVLRRR